LARVETLDPVLAELRAVVRARLPSAPSISPRDIDRRRALRLAISRTARLQVGILGLEGQALDVGTGGLFLKSDVLVETGERGVITVGDSPPAKVRVAWIRGPSHPLGQGIGLAFEHGSPAEEQRSLELVLALMGEAGNDNKG